MKNKEEQKKKKRTKGHTTKINTEILYLGPYN